MGTNYQDWHRWTPQEEDNLIRWYEGGKSYKEMERILGYSYLAIRGKINCLIDEGRVIRRCKKRIPKMADKLPMTQDEIRSSYKFAKDQEKQIIILAELNACDVKLIKAIVKGE